MGKHIKTPEIGDILKEEWDQADLGGEREKSKQLNCFDLAILISQNI